MFCHCDNGLRPAQPHTVTTGSPMLRVSKRLTVNVIDESEVNAGTSAAEPPTVAARLLRDEITSSTIPATSQGVQSRPPVCLTTPCIF